MENSTPMLNQYNSIKTNHKDCILFFRLGDFYEMFGQDAKIASAILNVVLTSRDAGKAGRIPMCGIPFHAADNYIAKLIKAGHKVAICEQVEDPALAKGLVKRDVIRIITAGTYIDNNSSDQRYLLCLYPDKKEIGLALLDINSAVILTNQYQTYSSLLATISKLPITECIYPAKDEMIIKQLLAHPLIKSKNIPLSPYDDWCFNLDIAQKLLTTHFHVHNLKGFGIENLSLAIASCGALLEYCKQMNRKPMQHIDKLALYNDSEYTFISPAACYGLELEQLFKTIDSTLTPLGKRKLKFWLYHPLKNPLAIVLRQKAINLLKNNQPLQNNLAQTLNHIPDIEKSISRISSGYTAISDLLALRNTLNKIPEIQAILAPLSQENYLFKLDDIAKLREFLTATIDPNLPIANSEGKVILKGYNQELDSLKELQENQRQWLKDLQAQEIQRTKINSLKIGFTSVFGYYIEISKANLHLVPSDYIRKQTLVNGERFITPQLKEFEEKILTAQEKIIKMENEIIKEIQDKILADSSALHNMSDQLAIIDTIYSLSLLAAKPGYILPEINLTTEIKIKAGKHPQIAANLSVDFIPNDTLLDCQENTLLIITGPNMAGKSTYIRQVAILVIMGQMGSFIPAESATIGVVDKIFTRIGAHDDISRGQSTFMVEMSETADILNNLSERSLIILDEIGRGTSTFDGLSLAWAIAEYIQMKKARTLFATHFHELTALEKLLSGVKNYNIAVKEWQDEIVFLHKIIPGGTDDRYGIYVAKISGIPKDILTRAKKILGQLENSSNLKDKICDNNMIDQPDYNLELPLLTKLEEKLETLDINKLTPLEALNKLQELKDIIAKVNTRKEL